MTCLAFERNTNNSLDIGKLFDRYPVTQNISINPGLLAVINSEGDSDRNTIYVGTIRTIFKF